MTGVQTCALPICFPVTIGGAEEQIKTLVMDISNLAMELKEQNFMGFADDKTRSEFYSQFFEGSPADCRDTGKLSACRNALTDRQQKMYSRANHEKRLEALPIEDLQSEVNNDARKIIPQVTHRKNWFKKVLGDDCESATDCYVINDLIGAGMVLYDRKQEASND